MMKTKTTLLVAASAVILGMGVGYAHQGAHIESTTGTLSSVTNAYYTLSSSDSQYALPGAIGASSLNCPVGFAYQAPTTWPVQAPARCLHSASGQSFKAWVMVDFKEECDAASVPWGNPCGPAPSESGGCGDRLYVRTQANCSGCAASYTQVFVSANGSTWTYAETVTNSGTGITNAFIETYSDYRYVILALPGVTFAQTPRWLNVWTSPAISGCF